MATLKKIVLIVVAVVVVGFVAIQFVPVPARANPPVTAAIQWDSPETERLARAACFDCHSNETVWPWYSYVAPMSWLVAHDVEDGREKVNFSTLGGEEFETEELVEVIREKEMPLPIYLPMHPEANLTDAQREQLIAGFIATFGSMEGSEAGEQQEAGEAAENEDNERNEAGEGGEDNDNG